MKLAQDLLMFNEDIGWSAGTREGAAIRDRIHSFSDLEEGWHYGEGRSATDLAVTRALEVCSQLQEHDFNEVEVFPGIHGGITVFGYRGDDVLEIYCDQGGLIDLLHEVNGDVVYEWDDRPLSEVIGYLRGLPWMVELLKKKWLFDYSTLNSLIRRYDASLAMPSPSLPKMEEYRLFLSDVPEIAATPNADTLIVFTTPTFQETRLSFGR